jgi:hypothetical protein
MQAFLIAPAPRGHADMRRPAYRAEVAVVGLSAGCGTTTLALGLAQRLERADVQECDLNGARERAHRLDALVLVAGTNTEPALADIAAQMLREEFPRLLLVANRVTDVPRWSNRTDVCVPPSRLGAALVSRGRPPVGAFGAALRQLAELVTARRSS